MDLSMANELRIDRQTFLDDGYVVVRSLISQAEADALYRDCLRAVRGEIYVPTWSEHLRGSQQTPARGENRFLQFAIPSRAAGLQHWRAHACYQRALAVAQALAPESGLSYSYDQCFYKPPGSEAIVYPHQDAAYWGVLGVTGWIALSEVRSDMAPVQYYRGSHQRLLPHMSAPKAWNDVKDFMVVPDALEQLAIQPTSFVLEPGDSVFHSSLTIHGSGPNRGSSARCGLALHFRSPIKAG
jgi:ectoine hydroxylase-related dioxygenase (phytanoyl-CoA dioxygenase family)